MPGPQQYRRTARLYFDAVNRAAQLGPPCPEHLYGTRAELDALCGTIRLMRVHLITAEFLDEACVDVATVSIVEPMPGTPTFRRLSADGRILTTDWSKYDGKNHVVCEPARMSPAELEAGTEWVARRLYSPRSIVRRLAGSRARLWWTFPRNVSYMLAGLSNAGPSWDPAEHERSSGRQIRFANVQR